MSQTPIPPKLQVLSALERLVEVEQETSVAICRWIDDEADKRVPRKVLALYLDGTLNAAGLIEAIRALSDM